MPKNTEETLEGDNKAFLEQLHLINLSVIATCLLLFVGANFESNGAIESAYKDARSIRLNAQRFVNWLDSNHLDLDSQLSSLILPELTGFHKDELDLHFRGGAHVRVVYFRLKPLVLSESVQHPFPVIRQEELHEFKETLAGFKEIWKIGHRVVRGVRSPGGS